MPFSPTVKSRAVEAAAGHCCVCHRFDAGHIEVHHILPQADGGSDDFENAIALCFDCHTWAGHYHSRHPKGFRYSPEFLRSARKSWYERVAAGPISTESEDVLIHTRYLISREHDISARLLSGDLSAAPIKDAVLASNEFGRWISDALRLRPQGLRRFYGDSFTSIDSYLAVHPNARCHQEDLGGYAYYDCVRECSEAELTKRISEDKLTARLLTKGVPLAEICVAAADNNQCGDGSLSETYLTRPIWVVFLALTNISDRPIALDRVAGQRDTSEDYRSTGTPSEEFVLEMPPCEISTEQTVLVPIALLLGPIEELSEEQFKIKEFDNTGESVEIMNLTEFSKENLTKFRLYGPAFWPQQVVMRRGGIPLTQGVHQLNPDSVYTLDRVWQCGSCPHLFVLDRSGEWSYIGELIPKGERTEVVHSITLPRDAVCLVIAELEDEETMLSEVSIDGNTVAHQIKLRKGDTLHFPVVGANSLLVKGAYFPLTTKVNVTHGIETRNRLVCQFLARLKAKSSDKPVDMAA